MSAVTFTLDLTAVAPILTRATTQLGYGIDASMYQDANERYALPGSLVKGCLRQSWEEISHIHPSLITHDWIDALLGQESGSRESPGKPVTRLAALLRFDDLVNPAEPESRPPRRYRIAIDQNTGSVEQGALQVLESPWRAGAPVAFSGAIHFTPTADLKADDVERWLRIGLGFVTSLGAERTIGFGRLRDFRLTRAAEPEVSPLTVNGNSCRISMSLQIHQPFCIAKPRAGDNLFESEEVIPGGVIKGAIAAAWCRFRLKDTHRGISPDMDRSRKELAEAFDKITISHAFPSNSGTRPVEPPLSLVRFGDKPFDILQLCAHDAVLAKSNGRLEAPKFAVDWKTPERNATRKDFGWPEVQKRLSIRTQIDRSYGRAEDAKLFGIETIVPGDTRWLFSLNFPAEGDSAQLARDQLLKLIPRLDVRIGKTKAAASFSVIGTPVPVPAQAIGPNQVAVTLQTPALLSQPSADLNDTYQEYWSDHSEGSLQLARNRFFARQRLAGGYYLHNKFRSGPNYQPWLLTAEGSVFLLDVLDPKKAKPHLDLWKATGLPVHYKLGDPNWEKCPYLPQNGYGEIAVDLPVHTANRLPEGSYDTL